MTRFARVVPTLAAVGLAAAGMTSGWIARAAARTIVYVSCAKDRTIRVLELDDRGRLTPIQTTVVSGAVMPLAVSPDRRFVYASLRSEPYAVSSFAIDRHSGRLTPLGAVPLADNMAYLSTDRSGRFLLGASYSGSRFSINRIRSGGAVEPAPLTVIETGPHAHAIATDLSNRFLFVPNLGADRILQYRFDAATGAIRPNEPPFVATPTGAGPRHIAFHPSGRFVFGINELDATVVTYRLRDNGALTALAAASAHPPAFTGKPWAADVHVTPDGRFLYASERTSSTLAAFRVAEDGQLASVGTFATETQPRGFNIDPGGRFLVAAGQLSQGLRVHAIDRETGALTDASRLRVGDDPNWVEIITPAR
jgi:6-phosphogluconolactonase